MTQRAWLELDRLDHQVKVHIGDSDEGMEQVVKEYQPDLIVAPFLKKRIPQPIWKNFVCFVIHPGIKGDRGASSLDWAILNDEKQWGVTILQAGEKMDAGDIWDSREFEMRPTTKACLYRHEVTQAAIHGLLEAVEKFQTGTFKPEPLDYSQTDIKGTWKRSTTQDDFRFSWSDSTNDILRKIRAADSDPGVLIELGSQRYYCFGAHPEEQISGKPGQLLARRNRAVCIGIRDGALWITHLKRAVEGEIKLPATLALGDKADRLPENLLDPFETVSHKTCREIYYQEVGDAGFLHFDFYNGAMSTDQCQRLQNAFIKAKERPVKVIVLMGSRDLWSNGIHLNVIEHAENPADESWKNINAINDLIKEIILTDSHYVIAAMQGNAGAGGVPLALAADKVLARRGIVLNPHTRNMGLYGSEYWTYLLPRRIGVEKATHFTEQCLPWGTAVAKEIGLIDDSFGDTAQAFRTQVKAVAREVSELPWFDKLMAAKRFQRRKDEAFKPLANYRQEELEQMWKNFYEDNWGYDFKRYCFVHKIFNPEQANAIQTDLYSSRRQIYRRRKWESIHYRE